MHLDRLDKKRETFTASPKKSRINHWTEEDIEKVRDLHRKGYSIKGIATIMGRTASAIVDIRFRTNHKNESKDKG